MTFISCISDKLSMWQSYPDCGRGLGIGAARGCGTRARAQTMTLRRYNFWGSGSRTLAPLESPGELVKGQMFLIRGVWGGHPGIYMSNKFPREADPADPGTTPRSTVEKGWDEQRGCRRARVRTPLPRDTG